MNKTVHVNLPPDLLLKIDGEKMSASLLKLPFDVAMRYVDVEHTN